MFHGISPVNLTLPSIWHRKPLWSNSEVQSFETLCISCDQQNKKTKNRRLSHQPDCLCCRCDRARRGVHARCSCIVGRQFLAEELSCLTSIVSSWHISTPESTPLAWCMSTTSVGPFGTAHKFIVSVATLCSSCRLAKTRRTHFFQVMMSMQQHLVNSNGL